MSDAKLHIPVMTQEILTHLSLHSGDCIVDGTVGMGGHSEKMAAAIESEGCLIAIDRDSDSLTIAKERLKDFPCQRHFVQGDFRNTDTILNSLNISEIDGVLLDLGISSYQLEIPERGFSLRSQGPLDMRMDKNSYISAYDLVNSLSEHEISSILKNFGEERWHKRIAHYLVNERQKKPLESTQDLNNVVLKAIPYRYQHQRIHPATRTFQAFRIAVNRELESLEIFLDKCVSYLKKGARMCIISFHSLEDRIVKEKFKSLVNQEKLKVITKKPLRPSESEVSVNPRARSARLRVAERI